MQSFFSIQTLAHAVCQEVLTLAEEKMPNESQLE
jgi:hypothetical protein